MRLHTTSGVASGATFPGSLTRFLNRLGIRAHPLSHSRRASRAAAASDDELTPALPVISLPAIGDTQQTSQLTEPRRLGEAVTAFPLSDNVPANASMIIASPEGDELRRSRMPFMTMGIVVLIIVFLQSNLIAQAFTHRGEK
jgi:hypothetical protein